MDTAANVAAAAALSASASCHTIGDQSMSVTVMLHGITIHNITDK